MNTNLKSIVERIENLTQQKSDISFDIAEVLKESKSNGFDVKAIRKILAIRKDPAKHKELESIMEVYMNDLQMDMFVGE